MDTAWESADLEWQRLLPKLVNAHDAKARDDLLRGLRDAADHLLREAIALVPQDWRGFVERLIHAWQDIAAGTLAAAPDPDADPAGEGARAGADRRMTPAASGLQASARDVIKRPLAGSPTWVTRSW